MHASLWDKVHFENQMGRKVGYNHNFFSNTTYKHVFCKDFNLDVNYSGCEISFALLLVNGSDKCTVRFEK